MPPFRVPSLWSSSSRQAPSALPFRDGGARLASPPPEDRSPRAQAALGVSWRGAGGVAIGDVGAAIALGRTSLAHFPAGAFQKSLYGKRWGKIAAFGVCIVRIPKRGTALLNVDNIHSTVPSFALPSERINKAQKRRKRQVGEYFSSELRELLRATLLRIDAVTFGSMSGLSWICRALHRIRGQCSSLYSYARPTRRWSTCSSALCTYGVKNLMASSA